ncbi:LysE family translocator [Paenibacillus sp. GCM10023252]|uniref:LysE family translocator n=1 Tax=Paenibacillus sp. GCM10023252 TaxID=3252649 RepID=UPI0036233D59
MELWLRGISIGLAIAAPVGPIGILCIRHTLLRGRLHGFLAGCGAATADVIYGIIAASGFSVLSQYLTEQWLWIHLAGGIFLLYLAIRTYRSPVSDKPDGAVGSPRTLIHTYAGTLVLTLTNPLTILSFAGLFAGLSGGEASSAGSFALVVGIFTGSLLWWLLLCMMVGWLRARVNASLFVWINRVSGTVLLGFAVHSLYGVIAQLNY